MNVLIITLPERSDSGALQNPEHLDEVYKIKDRVHNECEQLILPGTPFVDLPTKYEPDDHALAIANELGLKIEHARMSPYLREESFDRRLSLNFIVRINKHALLIASASVTEKLINDRQRKIAPGSIVEIKNLRAPKGIAHSV